MNTMASSDFTQQIILKNKIGYETGIPVCFSRGCAVGAIAVRTDHYSYLKPHCVEFEYF